MNYSLLGDEPSAVDITQTSVSAGTSTTSSVAGLVTQVSHWKSVLASANSDYDKAAARKELAEAELELAKARAAQWLDKRKWYILGIGGSVLVLGAVIVLRK